jgi:transposase
MVIYAAKQPGWMMSRLFLLKDVQWAAIEPHLVDDRRVISVISSTGCAKAVAGGRCRPNMGRTPRSSIVGTAGSRRGVWQCIFAALAGCADPPPIAMIDSSTVKAHRSAAGAKKGCGRCV